MSAPLPILRLDTEPQTYAEVAAANASKRALDDVWRVDWSDLDQIEFIPGCRFCDDTWTIPLEWASGGQKRKPHNRTIVFTRAIPKGWAREDARTIDALRRAKRISALLFLKTVRVNNQTRRPFKPSTWVKITQNTLGAVRFALTELDDTTTSELPSSSCPDAAIRLFQSLPASRLEALIAQNKAFGGAAVRRLGALSDLGALDDWPSAGLTTVNEPSNKWQPFEDDFLTELAKAALWFTEELGPDLISCWEDLRAIKQDALGRRRQGHLQAHRKVVAAQWEGPTLRLGYQFPYRLNVSEVDGKRVKSEITAWPPRDMQQVRRLSALLQAAHLIVVLLSTGARDHEACELLRDCLEPATGGFMLTGRTFKLSDDGNGGLRNWPLPKVAVAAIRQQQRLARLMHPTGKRLFVAFADRGDRDMSQAYFSLQAFAKNVNLLNGPSLGSLCDGNVHPHRFRKSVARLVGLALVGANQILFDILGHRDPTMTLNYILSDPEMAADVDQVRREAAQLLAQDALVTADENGGPAAEPVRRLARRHMPDRATPEQEVDGLAHAARILSQNGEVLLVKTGTLCTKTFQQRGPCTGTAGQPDIGSCEVDCMHRLELAAARADHERAVEQILSKIGQNESMERAFWQGQLVAHLSLHADLRMEMLARQDIKEALVGLPPRLRSKLEALSPIGGTPAP